MLLKKFIKPDCNIIDVGANLGQWTVEFGKLTNGKVYAFEPQKDIYYQLCGNIFINNLSDKVDAYKIALSNHEKHDSELWLSSFGKYNDGTTRVVDKNNGGNKCTVKSLDSYNFDNVCLIKIDVEGNEIDVMKGAVDTIRRNRPAIIFES